MGKGCADVQASHLASTVPTDTTHGLEGCLATADMHTAVTSLHLCPGTTLPASLQSELLGGPWGELLGGGSRGSRQPTLVTPPRKHSCQPQPQTPSCSVKSCVANHLLPLVTRRQTVKNKYCNCRQSCSRSLPQPGRLLALPLPLIVLLCLLHLL